jgi:uncharacterized protein (TIGR04255 family)
MGLRYVNHLQRPAFSRRDWTSLIRPELVGIVASDLFGEELQQAVTDIRLTRPDGQLAFRHGLVPLGPDRALGYLLDFDYYSQVESRDLDPDSILGQFDAFHDTVYSFFRWCVTDRALLEFRRSKE